MSACFFRHLFPGSHIPVDVNPPPVLHLSVTEKTRTVSISVGKFPASAHRNGFSLQQSFLHQTLVMVMLEISGCNCSDEEKYVFFMKGTLVSTYKKTFLADAPQSNSRFFLSIKKCLECSETKEYLKKKGSELFAAWRFSPTFLYFLYFFLNFPFTTIISFFNKHIHILHNIKSLCPLKARGKGQGLSGLVR